MIFAALQISLVKSLPVILLTLGQAKRLGPPSSTQKPHQGKKLLPTKLENIRLLSICP